MQRGPDISKPAPAIVLSLAGTGLAVTRCLAAGGVKVYAVLFPANGPGPEIRRSRLCEIIQLDFPDSDHDSLAIWLREFSRRLASRPVVIPTSDGTALFLAQHRAELADHCILPRTTAAEMQRIVSKDGLYQAAIDAGVPAPPTLIEPNLEALAAWCITHAPPYIAKPFYQNIPGSGLPQKNRMFAQAAPLLAFARAAGMRRVIVQRMIESGDGNVYDAYGLANRQGQIVTLASHRRIRQYPCNTGATSYGEIPVQNQDLERRCFEHTRALLSAFRYHGIFGIEWLHEPATGNLYLVDFNARPFSSIGHLKDCGLNLPLLAHQELTGGESTVVAAHPVLQHRYWTDFNRDLRSFWDSRRVSGGKWRDFARDTLRSRSFAYFDPGDPGPALARAARLGRMALSALRRTSDNQK